MQNRHVQPVIHRRDSRPPTSGEPILCLKRDWFRLLADLLRAKVNNAEVARRLGLSHNTVRNWKYGIEPLHSKGEALLHLHAEHCPELAAHRQPVAPDAAQAATRSGPARVRRVRRKAA